MPVRNRRDGLIIVQDGTPGTPNEIVIAHEEGNLSWTETLNKVAVLDRGALDSRRAGDEAPCKVSFASNHVELCSDILDSGEAETPTAREVFHQIGNAAGWLSTAADGEAFAVRVIFWVLNPDSAGKDEKIVFEKVALDSLKFQEAAEANSLSFEAEDWETKPTITREDYAA